MLILQRKNIDSFCIHKSRERIFQRVLCCRNKKGLCGIAGFGLVFGVGALEILRVDAIPYAIPSTIPAATLVVIFVVIVAPTFVLSFLRLVLLPMLRSE